MILIEDASHFSGHADQLLTPSTEQEIAQILREAQQKKAPVTLLGGGTGLTGAGVPLGGTALALERMNRIVKIQWDPSAGQGTATLQPGVTLKELEQALEPRPIFYPPDPGETKASLGGTVATNASGPRSYQYGATRRYIRRLKIILPTGDPLDISRGQIREKGGEFRIELSTGKRVSIPRPLVPTPSTTKNAAGYYSAPGMDLIDLFIGAEGTLGVVTEVEVDLLKIPEAVLAGILFFDSEAEAFRFAEEIRVRFQESGKTLRCDPRALEFFDSRSLKLLESSHPKIPAAAQAALLIEQECRNPEKEALQKLWIRTLDRFEGNVPEPWLSFDPKEDRLFREFRHDLPVLVNEQAARNGFRKVGTDAAVPPSKGRAMFDFLFELLLGSGINVCIFGHLGDQNLHANLLPRTAEQFEESKNLYTQIVRKAVELKGTVSAEHGIGKIRIPYLEMMVGREGLRQMARVKKALDPQGILNPGNIFPADLLKEV